MTLEDYIRKQEQKAKGTYNDIKDSASDAARGVSHKAKDVVDDIRG